MKTVAELEVAPAAVMANLRALGYKPSAELRSEHGVHKTTVFAWVRNHAIRYIRIGGEWWIDAAHFGRVAHGVEARRERIQNQLKGKKDPPRGNGAAHDDPGPAHDTTTLIVHIRQALAAVLKAHHAQHVADFKDAVHGAIVEAMREVLKEPAR